MRRPLILFGAFDRHNFGDLLFPHVCAALLPARTPIFAGLAARDLRRHGGHLTQPLSVLAARLQGQPADLLHVGGELLTCTAHEAAVMLQPEDEAGSRLPRPCDRRLPLPVGPHLPYLAAPAFFPGGKTLYNAVGGVDFDSLNAPARTEGTYKLRGAHWIGVRERATQAALAGQGIDAALLPDCVSLVAELFGARIAHHARRGEPAAMAALFPQGYLALQFSADFGDEATLDRLAAQLQQVMRHHRLAIVLFRAGAAPWHDALAPYEGLAARLGERVHIFASLDIWDICALIAGSHGYCGSSLHGRIVAMAYGLPRLNLARDAGSGKQRAYAAAWDSECPDVANIETLASALHAALAMPRPRLREHALWLATRYRAGFAALAAALAQ